MFPIHRIGQTMGTKLISLLVGLVTPGLAVASDVRYAIIRLDGAGHGVLITDAPLAPTALVDIQYPLRNNRAVCCKRLPAREFRAVAGSDVIATNEVSGEQPWIYQMRVPKLWAEMPFVGMAAAGKGLQTRNEGSNLVSVDKHARLHRASLCASQEGVHVIENVGNSQRTHLYLSLEYEIEVPTCK